MVMGVAGHGCWKKRRVSNDATMVVHLALGNNGNCVSNFCSCDDGFTGISCDVMESDDSVTDSDVRDACEEENIDCNGHGDCGNTDDGWECACEEGYRGIQCRKYF